MDDYEREERYESATARCPCCRRTFRHLADEDPAGFRCPRCGYEEWRDGRVLERKERERLNRFPATHRG